MTLIYWLQLAISSLTSLDDYIPIFSCRPILMNKLEVIINMDFLKFSWKNVCTLKQLRNPCMLGLNQWFPGCWSATQTLALKFLRPVLLPGHLQMEFFLKPWTFKSQHLWKAKPQNIDNPFLSSWLDLYNKSDDVCLSEAFTATYKPILLPSLDCIQTHSSLPTWTWHNIWSVSTQMYPFSLPCKNDNNLYSYQKKMQLNIPAY